MLVAWDGRVRILVREPWTIVCRSCAVLFWFAEVMQAAPLARSLRDVSFPDALATSLERLKTDD